MRTYLRAILRSFSVQLLLLHLRRNFLLLFVWVIVALMMSGTLGPRLGLQYLFLDPEYLNSTGFWSFFLVGGAFGFFAMSWNLSTYLLLGGYFSFLASLSRPFFKFCINNALLPLSVFFFYCGLVVRFYRMETEWWYIGQSLSGLILGLVVSLFLYAIYFNLTNRDISYYIPKHRERPPNMGPGQAGRRNTAGKVSQRVQPLAPRLVSHLNNPYGVENYLNLKLQTRIVRSVAHYDTSMLQSIFRQNHTNAILIQFIAIAALAALGFLIDQPLFQIPAGASFLIMLSLLVAIIGAVSYWFSEWRLTLLVLLLGAINLLTSGPWVKLGNQAYGLDYQSQAPYSEDRLESLYGSEQLADDLANTEAILDNWKARQPEEKPPFVIVCASGGGLTAALWATHVAQSIDQCSNREFFRRTALMTGASGGMLGLGYLREAYLNDPNFAENATIRLDRISRDMLNPVAFSIVSNDLFLPLTQIKVGGKKYRRDRAYGFERELGLNTNFVLHKPLWSYREAEKQAIIPLLFITPSIVDDGRRLVISPQGVTYMTAPPAAMRGELPLLPDMVDFRWLLREQDADSLRFSTALRMNATYPYVLPLVRLPTAPTIRVMDAGYRDNYGIASAVRFVSVFEEWIKANTSGVHIVQISAFRESEEDKQRMDRRGVVESLFSPVGVAGNILGVQILDQEGLLGQLSNQLGSDFFHLHRFNYQPRQDDPLQTSVSLHLTDQERRQVLQALDGKDMQRRIDRLLQALR